MNTLTIPETFICMQVVYRQGMVKTFIAPQEILLADFMRTARDFGKIKATRFLPDVDRAAADLLIATGAVEVKGRT